MTDTVQLVAIELDIDGTKIRLPLEKARQLCDALKKLFPETTVISVPTYVPYPVYPAPQHPVWPDRTYPWITYCGSGYGACGTGQQSIPGLTALNSQTMQP